MAKRTGSISSIKRRKSPPKTKKRLAVKKERLAALAKRRRFTR